MGGKKNVSADDFDEQMAVEIYRKRNSFEAPENKGLETVFEAAYSEESKENEENHNAGGIRGRVPRAAKAKLQVKVRKITSQPYFVEDDEKTNLRKKQTAKLFKGRKKIKWKGLSAKQEQKLANIIADKSETEDEEELQPPLPPSIEPNLPFIVNDTSSTSFRLSDPSLPVTEDIKAFQTPKQISLAENKVTSANRKTLGRSAKSKRTAAEIDENIREADEWLGPLGFSDDEEENSKNRMDSSFKVFKTEPIINQPEKKKRQQNDRRKSKITKVRRSSRLFRGQSNDTPSDNDLGSIFHDVEIPEKRRQSRRSRIFSNNSDTMQLDTQ